MSISLDESQLQRLVDGELDSKQRREFLMAMDNDPKLWREVALAFVEDRIWRTDVNVAAEFPDMTHPARQFVQRNKALLLARLRDRAQAAGATDPDALADDLAFLIEGGYTASQTFGADAPRLIKSLPRTARVLLDAAIPARKPD